jgi:thymidylate kinase
MHTMLLQVFNDFEQSGVAYCLMRDADRLGELAHGGEVDLLVQPSQFADLGRLLKKRGFARLQDRGYAPHHFFIIYDQTSDGWLKLDIMTKVAFGRPVKNLHTDLATNCISHRRASGPTYSPAAEDEFLTLLLHCVLDKGHFAPHRQIRLQKLRQELTDVNYLVELLATYWLPGTTWSQLAGQIDRGDWVGLLAERPKIVAHLARRDPLGVRIRTMRSRALRQMDRWSALLRPHVPTVALLGPDGAGKSTLAHGIQDTSYFPTSQVYMGLYQKGSQRAARRLPGLNFVQLLLTQWIRYLSARYRQAHGKLVIFDRYSYDALLLSQHRQSWPKRVRRWLLAHACPPPDLVLVLDAPAETLYARKGEHTVATLEHQRQSYLELQTRLRQVSVLDTTKGAEQVRRSATALIWQTYAHRHNKE